MNTSEFLASGTYIDSGSPAVKAFAKDAVGMADDPRAKALALYSAVRDGIVYDPYIDFGDADFYRASAVIGRGRTFCVGKAALLAAVARASGIPARVGYADVKNHMTSRRLYELMKTDEFIWHSYAELYLNGRWVKATPAFDLALCDKVGLKPLDFDGETDSLFHEFDRAGRRHMEYLRDRGTFADVPFDLLMTEFKRYYPQLFHEGHLDGDFRSEAVAGDLST
jgi:transglutaminase-like putative cysteine protease